MTPKSVLLVVHRGLIHDPAFEKAMAALSLHNGRSTGFHPRVQRPIPGLEIASMGSGHVGMQYSAALVTTPIEAAREAAWCDELLVARLIPGAPLVYLAGRFA